MGQQVLALGLSCEDGFVPLDSELFISQTKVIALPEPFKDDRSTTAKRYQTAQQHTKPEMVEAMVKRAIRRHSGRLPSSHAWFGTKAIIRLSQETA